MRTLLARGLVASLLLVGGLVATAAPASAAEVHVPSGGVLELEGRGYGHGIGMSQYGAKGGADQGRTAHQVLSAYYPGATLARPSSTSVRVVLTRWDGRTTCTSRPAVGAPCWNVVAEPGQAFLDRATNTKVIVPSSVGGRAVTAVAVGSELAPAPGLTLWAYASGWHRIDGRVFAGPVDLGSPDQVHRTQWTDGTHDYRGFMRAVRTGDGELARVNVLGLEDYLLGVVPAEMPASWATAAVQAQGVAARTYAVAAIERSAARQWDICDTVSCQVYAGVGGESSTATAKLRSASPSDVRGLVLTSGGRAITAMFSSSNGGWSVTGGTSYLPARQDAWDPVNPWSRQVTAACLQGRYPGRGAFQRLVVTARDGNGLWGGRIRAMRLEFSGGTVTVGGTSSALTDDQQVRSSMSGCGASGGLRSSWFTVVGVSDPLTEIAVAGTGAGAGDLLTRLRSGEPAHRTWSGPVLGDPVGLGGATGVAPALARTAAGDLDAVLVGTNGALYSARRPAATTAWTGWTRVPGGPALAGRPAVVAAPDGTLHVFAVSTGRSVWHTWRTASGWGGWENLGGTAAAGAGVSAAVAADRSLTFVVRGTDDAVWAKSWRPGSPWQAGWTAVGGGVLGDPAIAWDGARQVPVVVVRGTDRAGWARVVPGFGAGGWTPLGGLLGGAPAATRVDGSGLSALVVGTNGWLYRKDRVGGAWSGGWTRLS